MIMTTRMPARWHSAIALRHAGAHGIGQANQTQILEVEVVALGHRGRAPFPRGDAEHAQALRSPTSRPAPATRRRSRASRRQSPTMASGAPLAETTVADGSSRSRQTWTIASKPSDSGYSRTNHKPWSLDRRRGHGFAELRAKARSIGSNGSGLLAGWRSQTICAAAVVRAALGATISSRSAGRRDVATAISIHA